MNTPLGIEAVISWLTQLIEELRALLAEVEASLARLTSEGKSCADRLDDLCLV